MICKGSRGGCKGWDNKSRMDGLEKLQKKKNKIEILRDRSLKKAINKK